MAHYQNQYDPARQTDEYGNPVGQKDDYGNPIGHHTGTTGGEYGTVGYETAPTGAGKYGGAPGSGTYNKEQHGNQVGERDEYGNPIGHHNGTTGDEYGTVGYETATTEAGKYGGAPGSGTYNKEQYGNPVGQRDEYGNPIGHNNGTTGGEYGTVGYETATTEAGKYGGAPGSGTYNKEQHGNPVGQRDEYGNPIGRHNGTTGGEYGTVGYETATTEAGKYGGAPGSGTYNKEQHGNPVSQRDEYGNPIGHYTGTTGGEYGTDGYETAQTGAGKNGGAPGSGTSTTPGGYYSEEQRHEKKGIMDKIKEKLPGHRHDH